MSSGLEGLSVRQLKDALVSLGVDTTQCIERSDLEAALREAQRQQVSQQTPTEAGSDGVDLSKPPVVTHTCANGGATVTYEPAPMLIGNQKDPKALVTLVHGLGDTAAGWADVAEMLHQQMPGALFMLPTAPMQPVTINMNMRCNAWYDIKSLGPKARNIQDGEGVLASSRYVALMAGHTAHRFRIPTSRIVFGGFSQGAAISIAAGLTAPFVAGGVMALSGYLAAEEALAKHTKAANLKQVPFLMCHGRMDPVVGIDLARMSRDALQAMGTQPVLFKEYNMQHSSCMQELEDIVSWLKKTITGL